MAALLTLPGAVELGQANPQRGVRCAVSHGMCRDDQKGISGALLCEATRRTSS